MLDFADMTLFTATLIVMGVSLVLMIVIPVLPGQFIIWLAALGFGYLTEWKTLTVGTFIILTLLTLIATILDVAAGWIGAKKGGAGWVSITLGLVLGFVGLIFFNAIGAILGTLIGIVGWEYYLDGNWQRAWRAGWGYLTGLLVSLVGRVALSLIMIGLFFWQAQ
jgi:uncharacterized protein YqgC (DUF456 family)